MILAPIIVGLPFSSVGFAIVGFFVVALLLCIGFPFFTAIKTKTHHASVSGRWVF
jgi:hypothetical protein